jgi:hypothetical protein
VTGDPCTEGKEVVGGFLLSVTRVDETVSISRDCHDFELGGTLQVRQVTNMKMP